MRNTEIESSLLVKASIAAFMRWTENEWDKYDNNESLNVSMVPNVEYLRQYNRLSGLTYPRGLLAMASIQINSEKGGHGKRFQQHETGRRQEDGTAFVSRLTPVQVGCLFRFVSDSLDHVMQLSSMFIGNNPGPTLVLKTNDTGFMFECRAFINPDMDIPQAESGEDGRKYIIDTTVIINSWHATIKNMGLIKRIGVTVKNAPDIHKSIGLQVKDGTVVDLTEMSIGYERLFDTTSPHFKDIEGLPTT